MQATWDDVRRISDELEVKTHLAGMEARDRWRALKPRVEQLERSLAREGKRAAEAVVGELIEVREALRKLRDKIVDEITYG